MKKLLYLFTIIIIAIIITTSVFAQTSNYALEFGLSLDIPDELITFTRNIDPNDPNLSIIGTTAEKLLTYFIYDDIYLNAFFKDLSSEINIKIKTNSDIKAIGSLSELSDTDINDYISYMSTEYENSEKTYVGGELYKNSKVKYIKTYLNQSTNDNKVIYNIQYYTINNGNAYFITLATDNVITDETESLLLNIVNSINYSAKTQSAETTAAGPSEETKAPSINDADSKTNILGLIIAGSLYSLPIIIYRYIIRKQPVLPTKGIKICIIYGIIVFAVMFLLLPSLKERITAGTVLLICGFINKLILSKAYIDEQDAYYQPMFAPGTSLDTEDIIEGSPEEPSYDIKEEGKMRSFKLYEVSNPLNSRNESVIKPVVLKSPKAVRLYMIIWFIITVIINIYKVSSPYTNDDAVVYGSIYFINLIDSLSGWGFWIYLFFVAGRIDNIFRYKKEKGIAPKVIYALSSIIWFVSINYLLIVTISTYEIAYHMIVNWTSALACWVNYEVNYHNALSKFRFEEIKNS